LGLVARQDAFHRSPRPVENRFDTGATNAGKSPERYGNFRIYLNLGMGEIVADHRATLSEACQARSISAAQTRCIDLRSRSSRKAPSSSKASSAFGTEHCGAITS